MFLYGVALFIHVMATMAMFIVIGLVMVSVARMRRAQTVEQLQERITVASQADSHCHLEINVQKRA